MKKQVIMGMTMVMAVSFSTIAFAAGTSAREAHFKVAAKEIETKYHLSEKSIAGMKKVEIDALQENLMTDLKLSGSVTKAALRSSLTSKPTETIELLKSVRAIDLMVEAARKEATPNQKSIDSILGTKDALLSLLSNANKIGAFDGPSIPGTMTKAQFNDATSSLNRLFNEVSKIATKYDMAESTGVVKVVKELEQVMKENKSLSIEEAFVEAIVRAKGISREEALKLLEKYKDCV